MYQLSGNDFIFVELTPHSGQLQCQGAAPVWTRLQGVTQIHIPPGCTFLSDTSTATGMMDSAMNYTPISYAWETDPKLLLAEVDLPRYKELLKLVDFQQEIVPRDAREVQRWISAQDRWNSHSNLTHSSVGLWIAIVVLLLLLCLIGYGCWRLYQWKKTQLVKNESLGVVYNPWKGVSIDNGMSRFREIMQ